MADQTHGAGSGTTLAPTAPDLFRDPWSYAIDAFQRGVLLLDVLHQRSEAASGITDFDELISKAQTKAAPARSLVSIEDVGVAVAFLSMNGAKLITGETLYIDGGYHIID